MLRGGLITNEETRGRRALVKNVETLNKMLLLNPGKAMVASAIMSVFKAGMLYCGKELTGLLGEWMVNKIHTDYNVCVTCGNEDAHLMDDSRIKNANCPKCENKANEEAKNYLALTQKHHKKPK